MGPKKDQKPKHMTLTSYQKKSQFGIQSITMTNELAETFGIHRDAAWHHGREGHIWNVRLTAGIQGIFLAGRRNWPSFQVGCQKRNGTLGENITLNCWKSSNDLNIFEPCLCNYYQMAKNYPLSGFEHIGSRQRKYQGSANIYKPIVGI